MQVIRDRSRTQQQEIACEGLLRALERLSRRKGLRVDVTWRELAAATGSDVSGMNQREASVKYRTVLLNQLDYLIAWGLLEGRGALYEPNGEGRCIVVTLDAGVAQSVRAAGYRRTSVRSTRTHRRASISSEVGAPLRGDIGGLGDFSRLNVEERVDAAARARELGTRDQSLLSKPVRAALVAAAEDGGDEWSAAALLRDRPGLASVPIPILAREAWRAAGNRDGRLSRVQLEAMCRASSQLERTGYGTVPPGPAAPAAAIIDLAFGGWAEHWRPRQDGRDAKPCSVGGLAVCLGKEAHRHLRGWRSRRAIRRPGAARG